VPQPRSVAAAAQRHVDDWDDASATIDRAVARLFSGRRRGAARDVTVAVRDATRRLEQRAARWAASELADVYLRGVQIAGGVTGVPLLADMWEAEISAIVAGHVDDVAAVGSGLRRGAAGFVVPDGLPVLSPGEVADLSPAELSDLLRHPIGLVRYRDGSYRSVADHGDMLTRTRSALAFNRATLDVAVAVGAGWVETFDGTGCNWVTHTVGGAANGAIVETEFAAAHPLAHPRCQRSFRPRPDIDSARRARKAVPLGLPFDDVANPLPGPGPTVRARPRVRRAQATKAVRARRSLRRR